MDVQDTLTAWRDYFRDNTDWRQLIKDVRSKETGCGPVFEIENPIDRPGESLAIADMRKLSITDVHYHAKGTEVYIVLQGSGKVVVGGVEEDLERGFVIVVPPNTAHFTVPTAGLVIAAVNIPEFNQDDYVVLTESDEARGFDKSQYDSYIVEEV